MEVESGNQITQELQLQVNCESHDVGTGCPRMLGVCGYRESVGIGSQVF